MWKTPFGITGRALSAFDYLRSYNRHESCPCRDVPQEKEKLITRDHGWWPNEWSCQQNSCDVSSMLLHGSCSPKFHIGWAQWCHKWVKNLALNPSVCEKWDFFVMGGLLLGTCPEILIGRCLVKQLQGISHYYQQGQSKVRFCRANVPEKSRTASTASRYSGCLIIQEKHKDFPKKKWSHNFCPKNCSVIVPSTDDLGLEASCHGAKEFPARAANDCCQLPPHDVPCDTALPKKKKAKDPAASVGTSNLSGEVNVYNTCNLLSGGKIDGFVDTAGGLQRSHLVQRKASHRSIFG